MGRGRHKKIKSCDPFYKGPKAAATLKSEKLTTNNEFGEQAIPRKVQNFMRQPTKKIKDTKPGKKSKVTTASTKLKNGTRFQQKAGESKRDYFNRIDREAATAMAKSMLEGRTLSERRKKHLRGRKEKLKDKRQQNELSRNHKNLEDEVKFGEVAQQPPSLTVKPRKAAQEKSSKSLLLHSLVTPRNEDRSDKLKSKKRKHMTPQERASLDRERERVITAYRMAKKQKMDKIQLVQK